MVEVFCSNTLIITIIVSIESALIKPLLFGVECSRKSPEFP